MFAIRVTAFVLTVLLASGELAPEWEVLALVLGLAVASIRDIFGLTFAVLAAVMLIQEPTPSETLMVVAAVFSGVSTFLCLGRPSRDRDERTERIRLSPSLRRRLRRWERVTDF